MVHQPSLLTGSCGRCHLSLVALTAMTDDEAQRVVDRMAASLKRGEELLSGGMTQLDKLQELMAGDTPQAYDLAKTRAMLTIEESRFLASLATEELRAVRGDWRLARAESIARWSALGMWAAAVATAVAAVATLVRR